MNYKTDKPCHICGRVIPYRNIQRYKARIKHLCPHGKSCIAGHKLLGHGANWSKNCLECLNIQRAKAGIGPVIKIKNPLSDKF